MLAPSLSLSQYFVVGWYQHWLYHSGRRLFLLLLLCCCEFYFICRLFFCCCWRVALDCSFTLYRCCFCVSSARRFHHHPLSLSLSPSLYSSLAQMTDDWCCFVSLLMVDDDDARAPLLLLRLPDLPLLLWPSRVELRQSKRIRSGSSSWPARRPIGSSPALPNINCNSLGQRASKTRHPTTAGCPNLSTVSFTSPTVITSTFLFLFLFFYWGMAPSSTMYTMALL